MPPWAMAIVGYLLGSIPTGVIVARARGIDLRKVGSGNIGATNVARALGRKMGVLVLLLDAIKGLVAVLVASRLGTNGPWLAGVGFAAVVGHIFPVWLKLRGGKGAATSVGVLIGLVPVAGAAAGLTYLTVYAKTRTSSLGSLSGAIAALIAAPFATASRELLALVVVMFVTIVLSHRENIRRLARGQENRV
ncbi:MAG: glycerol-3-phosphate 1-O-acyltransferase PlsY [Deltaproteobacteria bacterium]|nr:glycerol-3-phosphate 1-O-acyltransferase PlsY [Deltaproteobacteria bacterium]